MNVTEDLSFKLEIAKIDFQAEIVEPGFAPECMFFVDEALEFCRNGGRVNPDHPAGIGIDAREVGAIGIRVDGDPGNGIVEINS